MKNTNNKILKKYNQRSGQAAVEMLIALVVLVFATSAAIMVTFGSQSTAVDTETNGEALLIAREMIEQERSLAQQDFNLVNPMVFSNQNDYYKKSVDVESVDLFTKKVVSRVSWNSGAFRPEIVELATLFTNPFALGGGDTCSSVLSGDWTNPSITSYEFGADILEDTSSGFPITSIQAYNHKLYVTVDNDNGNNPGTFFILDISNPAIEPVVLEEFDNAVSVGRGYNAVAVDGKDYAYLANAYGSNFDTCNNSASCSQLQIVDISTSPLQLAGTYKIPGVTGSSGQSVGKSIFYKDGIVYLGLAKAEGPEFNIIDVGGGGAGGSPTNPVLVGSYEIDAGINSISVRGDHAYIASPDDQELKIFDISNPASPVLVGGFDAPGGGANFGNGKSMYQVGSIFYFGRTLLSGNEFYILDAANPETNLPIIGSMNVTNGGANTSVNGILIREYLAFLVTSGEFQTWRVDNPANITQYADPLVLPPGTGGGLQGTATDCEGNYIFVGSLSSNDKGYISVITGG